MLNNLFSRKMFRVGGEFKCTAKNTRKSEKGLRALDFALLRERKSVRGASGFRDANVALFYSAGNFVIPGDEV